MSSDLFLGTEVAITDLLDTHFSLLWIPFSIVCLSRLKSPGAEERALERLYPFPYS